MHVQFPSNIPDLARACQSVTDQGGGLSRGVLGGLPHTCPMGHQQNSDGTAHELRLFCKSHCRIPQKFLRLRMQKELHCRSRFGLSQTTRSKGPILLCTMPLRSFYKACDFPELREQWTNSLFRICTCMFAGCGFKLLREQDVVSFINSKVLVHGHLVIQVL